LTTASKVAVSKGRASAVPCSRRMPGCRSRGWRTWFAEKSGPTGSALPQARALAAQCLPPGGRRSVCDGSSPKQSL
jgi:hypothetical protein